MHDTYIQISCLNMVRRFVVKRFGDVPPVTKRSSNAAAGPYVLPSTPSFLNECLWRSAAG